VSLSSLLSIDFVVVNSLVFGTFDQKVGFPCVDCLGRQWKYAMKD
jgi:hypothetical protein